MQSLAFFPSYITFGETTDATLDQDFPKGDHFFYIQENAFEYVTIWNRITGRAVVPRTIYSNIFNVATSAPYASANELRDALRANFFIEQSGGSMPTPTLKTVSQAAAAGDDNNIFESSSYPFLLKSFEFGNIVEVRHSPNNILMGSQNVNSGFVSIPCDRNSNMVISYDAAQLTMNGGDMGNQMIDIHISQAGVDMAKLNLQPAQVILQASQDGATLQLMGDPDGDTTAEIDCKYLTLTALKTSVTAPAQSGVIFPVSTDENGNLSFVTKFVSQAGLPKLEWAAAATLPGPSQSETTTSEEPLLFGTNCAFMIQGAESTIGPWKSETSGTAFSTVTIDGYLRVAIRNTDGTLNRMVRVPFVEENLPVSP